MTDNGVEQIVRSARATIAMLALELRAAQRDADVAERTSGGVVHADDEAHAAARDRLRSALVAKLAERRSELAEQVERARTEASRRVVAAQNEAAELLAAANWRVTQDLAAPSVAADLVGAARQELLEALLAETSPDRPPSSHRTVSEARALMEPGPEAPSHDWPLPPSGDGHAVSEGRLGSTVPASAIWATPVITPPAPSKPEAPETMTEPTLVTRAAAPPAGSSRRARLLHLDVLLPLAAGVVVFVALIAWLG